MKCVLALPVFALGCALHSASPAAPAQTPPTGAAEPSRSETPHDPAISSTTKPGATDAPATDACSGQVTEELVVELQQRGVESRHCYERALQEDKSLKGRMLVEATYEADGTRRDVTLATDAVGHAAMASCVLGLFAAPVRSAPTGGCVVVRIPLNVQPQPAADEVPEP